MPNVIQDLFELTKQLLPTGRAFRIPVGSTKEKVLNGLLVSENEAYNAGVGILDSILPDNDNFTDEDATRWEERLGMIDGSATTLAERKAAIRQNMNHPGAILARQSRDYIEDQLQLAGFDVYVYENIPEQTAAQVLAPTTNTGNFGGFNFGQVNFGSVFSVYSGLFNNANFGGFNFGQMNFGGFTYNQKIVNFIDETKDANFNTGSNLKCVFFIGGPTLGSFAGVPIERKEEFRRLVLTLKPLQTVGFLFIDYV